MHLTRSRAPHCHQRGAVCHNCCSTCSKTLGGPRKNTRESETLTDATVSPEPVLPRGTLLPAIFHSPLGPHSHTESCSRDSLLYHHFADPPKWKTIFWLDTIIYLKIESEACCFLLFKFFKKVTVLKPRKQSRPMSSS